MHSCDEVCGCEFESPQPIRTKRTIKIKHIFTRILVHPLPRIYLTQIPIKTSKHWKESIDKSQRSQRSTRHNRKCISFVMLITSDIWVWFRSTERLFIGKHKSERIKNYCRQFMRRSEAGRLTGTVRNRLHPGRTERKPQDIKNSITNLIHKTQHADYFHPQSLSRYIKS